MSSFAVAGGDIAPVEEQVVVEPVVTNSGFYLGLAYGMGEWNYDRVNGNDDGTFDFDTIILQAGYNFNKYIAVEGRYWFGLDTSDTFANGDSGEVNIDAWGIYVKPQYPVTEAFKIYGLLGYASISSLEWKNNNGGGAGDYTDQYNYDGFSWGLGAGYTFTDNIEVFVDYVSIYDDTLDMFSTPYDIDFSTWNFGVTYKF